jgi:hypothetical protein
VGPDGLPTLEDVRKRVISELVDVEVAFARRRHPSRRARLARALRWRVHRPFH